MREPIFCCDVHVDVYKKTQASKKFSFKKVITDVPVVGTENDLIMASKFFDDMIHRSVHGDGYGKTKSHVDTVVATRIVRKKLLSYTADNAAWNLTVQSRIPSILKLIQMRSKTGLV